MRTQLKKSHPTIFFLILLCFTFISGTQPPTLPHILTISPQDVISNVINPTFQEKCRKLNCRNGCSQGACLPNKCFGDQHCQDTHACRNGLCEQACQDIICPTDETCIHGECSSKTCNQNSDCQTTQTCRQNYCINQCQCSLGYKCIHGDCIREKTFCKKDLDYCGSGEICSSGVCVDSCSGLLCKDKQICVDGRCMGTVCGDTECIKDFYCKNGKCHPNFNICTDIEDYQNEIILCTDPRPTYETCPTFANVYPGPSPSFCGITATGKRIDISNAPCFGCMNQDIIFILGGGCQTAPLICKKNQICRGYYCQTLGCKTNDQCPYSWQVCNKQTCIDKCQLMKCQNCKYGLCNYELKWTGENCLPFPQKKFCDLTKYKCSGFGCIDNCEKKDCPPYYDCVPDGRCVPQKSS